MFEFRYTDGIKLLQVWNVVVGSRELEIDHVGASEPKSPNFRCFAGSDVNDGKPRKSIPTDSFGRDDFEEEGTPFERFELNDDFDDDDLLELRNAKRCNCPLLPVWCWLSFWELQLMLVWSRW